MSRLNPTSSLYKQCCGTVKICCGSDFEKVLVPVPVPDLYNILHRYKILPFHCQMQHYFPERWPFIFDLFIPFYVGTGTGMHSGSDKSIVTVPAIPVSPHCLKVCFTLKFSTHRQPEAMALSKIFFK
jgi:hypothetical protein